MTGGALEILVLNALQDNYVYLLHDPITSATATIDPSEARPVSDALRARGWRLDTIFNTHHHWDHVGGNEELKRETGARIVVSHYDGSHARIPGADATLKEGEIFRWGSYDVHPLELPGHTLGHVALWIPQAKVLFTGDTLFSIGCGRLFEGTPGQMWASLSKLRALPDDTKVYCGHDYTAANVKFALSLEPANEGLKRKSNTVPSLLGEEKALNPFLRADDAAIARLLKLETSGPVKVFAELRRRKDVF